MRATVMYQAGDVRVETVPDPVLHEPTDAIVRVTSACICGSDLWPYQSMPLQGAGPPHGSRVHRRRRGGRLGGLRLSSVVTWSSPRSSGRTTRATSAERVCTHRAATVADGALQAWTAVRARRSAFRRLRARW